jgi:hypothetical protein
MYDNIPDWLDEKLRKDWNNPVTHQNKKGIKKKEHQEMQEAMQELYNKEDTIDNTNC